MNAKRMLLIASIALLAAACVMLALSMMNVYDSSRMLIGTFAALIAANILNYIRFRIQKKEEAK